VPPEAETVTVAVPDVQLKTPAVELAVNKEGAALIVADAVAVQPLASVTV
jgi:hypothetical protein